MLLEQMPVGNSAKRAKPHWEAGPCGIAANSGSAEFANYTNLKEALDDVNSRNYEFVTWPHWSGWVQMVFVRPGSDAAALCDEFAGQLQAPDVEVTNACT